MEEKNKSKRSLLQARLSEKELEAVVKKWKNTTCKTLSEYVRKTMLEKTVTTRYRNQSLDDFMAEMIRLRKELNAIGNNYNQVVKKLYALQPSEEISNWFTLHHSAQRLLQDKVSEIKLKIAQINDQWLQ